MISVKIFLGLSILITFAMGGYVIGFAGAAPGIALIAFWFFFFYTLMLFYFYKKNNSKITRGWLIISASVIIGICLIALIAAVSLDSFNDFLGFSISYLLLNAVLFIYAYGNI